MMGSSRSRSPPRARATSPRVYTPPTPGSVRSVQSADKARFRSSVKLEPSPSRLSLSMQEASFGGDALPPGQNVAKLVQALVLLPVCVNPSLVGSPMPSPAACKVDDELVWTSTWMQVVADMKQRKRDLALQAERERDLAKKAEEEAARAQWAAETAIERRSLAIADVRGKTR